VRLPVVIVGLLAVAAVLAAAAPPAPGLVTAAAAVLSVTVAVLGGGPLALEVLRSADREDAARAAPDTGEGVEDAAAILRGGRWIGALERAGIAAAILSGWLAGVAVVLGIKGLGRYPELRHPGAAERFIIGTLVSVLWACACAGVALLVQG
jgi:hypothetical protein